MTYTMPYNFGPLETPKGLKWLIFLTLTVSLITALVDPVYIYFYHFPGLEYLFGLSREGLHQIFLWQPVTYLFVHDIWSGGITLSFLITLGFNMYILWIVGAQICERLGTANFVYFYIISGAIAGLLSLVATPYNYILVGPWASLLAIFTLWAMLGPDHEVLLFFLIPIKVKWLFVCVTAALLLITLSHLDLSSFILYFIAVLSAYLCGTVRWQLSAPFEFLHPFDRLLYRFNRLIHLKKQDTATKIYDLRTGEPMMDDDLFVDTMLTKIAKFGEESLSWSERKRLQEISIKKRHKSSN